MKYLKIATLFLGLAALTSCSDELTIDPVGLQTEEQMNKTPTKTAVENAVSSSYLLLSNTLNIMGNWDWINGLVTNNDIILQDIASDDLQKTWTSNSDQPWMDEIDNFTYTSTNGGVSGLWKYNYEGAKRVNTALDFLLNPNIETITGITTERKNQLLGEAYFLRAFYYFTLVNNFGDVPLIITTVKTYQEAFDKAVRAPKAEVWKQIDTDLALAKELLPNEKYITNSEKWRVTKGAVIALQAKAALYNEKWSEVIADVNELQGLGFYSLNANYFDNFNTATEFKDKEVIFSFDHQTDVIPARGNGYCALLNWGFFAPTTNFLNSFEPNDPRKSYTVNVDQRWVYKILGTTDGTYMGNDQSPGNKIYLRYADALLWKAEALNETGDYPGAIAIINQIRTRARTTITVTGTISPAGTLPDRPASSDKATIKNWLIAERRAELGFENQRMLDLKRWGIAKEVMEANGKKFQDRNMLYPIPQSEIDKTASKLTQNPGY